MHDFARSSSHHKQQPKSAAPKWLFLIAFLLLAGLAFGLYLLTNITTPASETPDTTINGTTKTAPEIKAISEPLSTPSKETKPVVDEYGFYELLPNSKVTVPTTTDSNKNTSAPAQKYTYLLQAGSFRSASSADKLRAQLLLKGLDVQTSKTTNSDKSIWHRVMVGPFTSRSKVNKAQDILAAANIEPTLYKVKQ